MHNAHVKLQSCMERISVDEFGLQAYSLRLLPLCRLQCASLSLSYHFFHRDWLHGWLQILVITGQIAKMSWSGLRYPAIYCQRRIITFWYPLNWRWMFSQCTQIISLLQSSWPAPQFRCSLVKKRDEVNIVAYQETQKKGRGEYGCKSGNTECRVIVEFMPVGKLGNLLLRSGWGTLFTLLTLYIVYTDYILHFYSAKNTRNLWLILLLPIWSEFLLGALHILRNRNFTNLGYLKSV